MQLQTITATLWTFTAAEAATSAPMTSCSKGSTVRRWSCSITTTRSLHHKPKPKLKSDILWTRSYLAEINGWTPCRWLVRRIQRPACHRAVRSLPHAVGAEPLRTSNGTKTSRSGEVLNEISFAAELARQSWRLRRRLWLRCDDDGRYNDWCLCLHAIDHHHHHSRTENFCKISCLLFPSLQGLPQSYQY